MIPWVRLKVDKHATHYGKHLMWYMSILVIWTPKIHISQWDWIVWSKYVRLYIHWEGPCDMIGNENAKVFSLALSWLLHLNFDDDEIKNDNLCDLHMSSWLQLNNLVVKVSTLESPFPHTNWNETYCLGCETQRNWGRERELSHDTSVPLIHLP